MIHSGNHEKGQNMQIMRLAAIVLAAVCGIAAAGSKQPETFDVWLRAGVQIDETGHVQDLQWEEQSKVHAVIAERLAPVVRSEEHTSELQSLMRISYAVLCLKKTKTHNLSSQNLL